MLDSAVVDVILGMLFVFFVFSLLVSGANEVISRTLGLRSRTLWRSLRRLLEGTTGTGDQRPIATTGQTNPAVKAWRFIVRLYRKWTDAPASAPAPAPTPTPTPVPSQSERASILHAHPIISNPRPEP